MKDENVQLIQHPSVRVIRKSTDYVVDGIGKVTVMEAIDPVVGEQAKEPIRLFQGFAVLGAQVGGQIRSFPVEFMIDGVLTVEEAFDKFQATAVATLRSNMEEARARAEAEQKRIITAPAGAVPKMKLVT